MDKDIFERSGVNLNSTDERARAAVKAFRVLQPTLSSYAKVLTKRANVHVEMAARDNGSTDGTKIYFRPPIALGDPTKHNRHLCDQRDENHQLVCPACSIREQVLVVIYHEIAHIAFDSFDKPTPEAQAKLVQQAIAESGTEWGKHIAAKIEAAPYWKKQDFLNLSGLVSQFLPIIINALEDARVNRRMFEARKGTKVMFAADTWKVFTEGVEQKDLAGNIIVKSWKEYPLNMQAIVGLFVKASGYEFDEWFVPPVVEALHDDQLTALVNQLATVRSVAGVYHLAFPVLARLRELGYCIEDHELPKPAPEEKSEDEQDDSSSGGSSPKPSDESGDDEGSEQESRHRDSDDLDEGSEDEEGDDDSSGAGAEGESDEADDSSSGDGDSASSSPDVNDPGNPTGDSTDSGDSGSDMGNVPDSEAGEEASADSEAESGSTSSTGGVADENEDSASPEGEGGQPGSGGDQDNSDPGTTPEESDDSDADAGSDTGALSDDDEGPAGEESGGDASANGGSSAGSPQDGPVDEDDVPAADGQASSDLGGADHDTEGSLNEEPLEESSGIGGGTGAEGVPAETGSGTTDKEVEPDVTVPEESDDPLDTGADDGEGGTRILETLEDYRIELTMGDAEEARAGLLKWGDHDEKPKTIAETAEEEKANTALEKAIIQGLYFETPSRRIYGVREHYFGKPVIVDGYNFSRAWEGRFGGFNRKELGVEGDFSTPESILGPALLKMRTAFSENRRGAEARNLRSGKVDSRVLGRRAYHNDDRLFKKKTLPGKRDYFVLIGLDVSGSTVGMNIALIKKAAFAQADLLHRMGIKFAIYAHSGNYHSVHSYRDEFDLDIYHIKDPDQPWDDRTKRSLLELGPDAANLDGHTLEYYRKILDYRNETDKIILYYTDGKMPAENHDEELEILQREIAICKKKHYTLLGVGIRTDSPARHGLDTVQVDSNADVGKVVDQLKRKLLVNA
jgi:hypothetical protein